MPKRVIDGITELKTLVGEELGSSDWFLMSQERITAFAELTEDRQWIHVDAERARRDSRYGTTIAHGFLTLTMLSEFSRQAVEIRGDYKMRINYGINRLRFPAAVPAGSRVRGHFRLASVEELEGAAQIVWDARVEVEGGSKPAVVCEWLTRIYY